MFTEDIIITNDITKHKLKTCFIEAHPVYYDKSYINLVLDNAEEVFLDNTSFSYIVDVYSSTNTKNKLFDLFIRHYYEIGSTTKKIRLFCKIINHLEIDNPYKIHAESFKNKIKDKKIVCEYYMEPYSFNDYQISIYV